MFSLNYKFLVALVQFSCFEEIGHGADGQTNRPCATLNAARR